MKQVHIKALRVADLQEQLLGRDDVERWISKLPPELVTNGRNFHGRLRFRSILDRVNHTRSGQKQNNHDQDWNDRPGQLNLCTSVHLSGLALRIPGFLAEFHDCICQQSEDHQKN